MAEVVGLAASIIQIAGAGAKLSVALYNFTNSAARADQAVKDIADDVELTSNALESVGRVFESEEAGSIVSKKAIQDANNIIKKCQSVFDEVSEIVEKRRNAAKDGKKSLSVMGKLAWPMKEQRVELNRRRLESLKNSLVLLLHVLQLAQGQARGKTEKSVLDEEREKIRELHQRQQDSLKSLQALENRFCHIAINGEETLRGSSVASRVPTLELMANAPVMELPPLEKVPKLQPNTIAIELSTPNDSDTSESDATMSGDDNEEQISTEELARAADHVKKLLKRIIMLQKNFDVDKKKHRKRHVHKMYQRFCRKFESGIKLPSAGDFGKVAPFIDFNMNDNSGSLENFDFDSFLHVSDESTQFPLDGFYFSQGQRAVPQQTTNFDAIPSTQSSQHPPLVSHESVETIPSFDAQTPHCLPVPSGSAASDFPMDLSGQQQRPSLGQGQSALAQQTPETLSQTWARAQRQAQSMAQQQAQAQHQQTQARHQAHAHAAMQPTSGMIQNLPSPAMPMLNRPMLPPVSTSSPSIPTYSRAVIPEISQSSQSGVESSLYTQAPMLTADSTLSPQPPIINTALQDYMYQLTFLKCRKRRSNPAPEQEQNVNSQSMSDRVSTGSGSDMSRKKAVKDPDASPFIHEWLNAEHPDDTLAKMPRRKRKMTVEERNKFRSTRALKACSSCKHSKLRCDGKYPCSMSTSAEQEWLPGEACRETNATEHPASVHGVAGHTSPLIGVNSQSCQASGYAEPGTEDTPGKESFKASVGGSGVMKRSRSSSDTGTGLSWPPPAAPDSSLGLWNVPYSHMPGYSPSSGYVEPIASANFPVFGSPAYRARTPPNVSMKDPYPSRSPDDGTEQDIGQRSSRKRRRLVKDEDELCSKDAADLVLKLGEDGEMTEIGNVSISVDRDIVDVLLEEWTVPVY